LHGRHQKSNQNGNDRDDHQQFNQSEPVRGPLRSFNLFHTLNTFG
jgi:hypothetical protein